MEATFKFFRVNDSGIPAFAIAKVAVVPEMESGVQWSLEHPSLKKRYEAVVLEGAEQALQQHQILGGAPAGIRLIELTVNDADTRSDAVKCAVAMATWKALGHPDALVKVKFREVWEVVFDNKGQP